MDEGVPETRPEAPVPPCPPNSLASDQSSVSSGYQSPDRASVLLEDATDALKQLQLKKQAMAPSAPLALITRHTPSPATSVSSVLSANDPRIGSVEAPTEGFSKLNLNPPVGQPWPAQPPSASASQPTGPFEIPPGPLAQQMPKNAFGWFPGPNPSQMYNGMFGYPGNTFQVTSLLPPQGQQQPGAQTTDTLGYDPEMSCEFKHHKCHNAFVKCSDHTLMPPPRRPKSRQRDFSIEDWGQIEIMAIDIMHHQRRPDSPRPKKPYKHWP
jgi:hypothetical protein